MRVTYLLLAAGLVTGCDAGKLLTGSDCTEQIDKTIDLESPATPAVQLKIESCRQDVDACGQLCTRAMIDNNLGGGGAIPTPGGGAPGFPDTSTFVPWSKCAVTFEGTTTHVSVEYSQFNGGPNCPQFGEGDVQP